MTDFKNIDWDDLRVVLTICREGSLAAAARILNSSHSTVFRQINSIEEKFATRFFNRFPHGYEMTDAGKLLLRMASDIEESIFELTRELQGKDLRLQGNIRLTAPEGLSHYLLMPHLVSFYAKHPDIKIELMPSSVDFEMARGEADLAIRMTDAPPKHCLAQEICGFNMGLYASKAYLESAGKRDIMDYEYIMSLQCAQTFGKNIWKNRPYPRIKFSSENVLTVANATIAGLGVAVLPCLIGEKEATLQRIDAPDFEVYQSKLWILTHADLRQTARVKSLMSHLSECLRGDRKFIEGERKAN